MTSVSINETYNTVVVENDTKVIVVEEETGIVIQLTSGGPQGPAGVGVAAGGTEGDLLVRTPGPPYSTVWTDAPTVDKLGFDLAASEAVDPGQLAWNATEGTLDVGTPGVTYQLGQELAFRCKNVSADVITDGEAVMFMGADSTTGHLEVAHMISNGSVPGYAFFGVATEPIAVGAVGYVTTLGKVRGIDTSAYPEDSVLWLDPAVPGGFTLTEPAAPALKVPAAAVVKSHPTEGVLFVRAETGRTIAQCHDVEIGLGAQDREYLGWSEAMQHWMPLPVPNAAPRSLTIAFPQAGDSFTIFRTDRETTIASVTALVRGTNTPQVTYELRYATDRSANGATATALTTVSNTTTGSQATLANQPIPINHYVWLRVVGVSGNVDEFNLSIGF